MAEREVILARLKSFYARNDPNMKIKTFEPMVNYAMTEGIDKLNALLLRKYGNKIEFDTFPEVDRDAIRHQVELFYLKHDPKKIDKPEDIESIVDFITIHGQHKLDEKLLEKYEEKLNDATVQDAVDMVRTYYTRLKLIKTEKDCKSLADWGVRFSFCTLNQRLIRKYGKGLGELDSKKQHKELRKKLDAFYEIYDETQLEDEPNMQKMTVWTLKHGIHRLNEKLQAKYGANLNTIKKVIKPPPGKPPKFVQKQNNELQKKKSEAKTEINTIDGRKVESDEKRIEDLRAYSNLFLAKHDTDRLYRDGVSEIIQFIIEKGEQLVEDELCSEYGEGLKSIEAQYLDLEKKLTMFYRVHDTDRLNAPMDHIIGWAIVHGEDKLNLKFMSKYDEDLEGAGLKKRLRIFYNSVGEDRSEAELSKIVNYAIERGLKKLNAKMKKKYGKSLEDMFAIDEKIIDEGSYIDDRLTQATFSTTGSSSFTLKQRSNRTAQQAAKSYINKNKPASIKLIEMGSEAIREKKKEKETQKVKVVDEKEEEETDLEDDYGEDEVVMKEKVTIDHKKTKNGADLKVTDSGEVKEEELETRFSARELDMRRGNRKSLKMMRQRRGSVVEVEQPMQSKLARFLEHVDDYHAVQRAEPTRKTEVEKKTKKDTFSYEKPIETQPIETQSFEEERELAPPRVAMPSVLIREKKAARNIVSSLMKFYKRHDKTKANGRAIRVDVEFALKHGREALNKKLMKQYGESLNSMKPGKKIKVNKKNLRGVSSRRHNFKALPRESMKELDGMLED